MSDHASCLFLYERGRLRQAFSALRTWSAEPMRLFVEGRIPDPGSPDEVPPHGLFVGTALLALRLPEGLPHPEPDSRYEPRELLGFEAYVIGGSRYGLLELRAPAYTIDSYLRSSEWLRERLLQFGRETEALVTLDIEEIGMIDPESRQLISAFRRLTSTPDGEWYPYPVHAIKAGADALASAFIDLLEDPAGAG